MAGVQAEQRVLRVGIVREAAGGLGIGPAFAQAVLLDHGLDQPIDVVLDACPILHLTRLGKDHGLQADDIGLRRLELAQGGQDSLNDRVVALDFTRIKQRQHRQTGPAAMCFPVASVAFLVAQELHAVLDGFMNLVDQQFLALRRGDGECRSQGQGTRENGADEADGHERLPPREKAAAGKDLPIHCAAA